MEWANGDLPSRTLSRPLREMNSKFVDDVRAKLRVLGYRNVPDRLVEEFARRLYAQGRLGSSRRRESPKSQPLAEEPERGRRSDCDLRQWARRLRAIRASARRLDSEIRALQAQPTKTPHPGPIAAVTKKPMGNTNHGPPLEKRPDSGAGGLDRIMKPGRDSSKTVCKP
jgi:hypothetical protein